jgi:hypothetical protein
MIPELELAKQIHSSDLAATVIGIGFYHGAELQNKVSFNVEMNVSANSFLTPVYIFMLSMLRDSQTKPALLNFNRTIKVYHRWYKCGTHTKELDLQWRCSPNSTLMLLAGRNICILWKFYAGHSGRAV